MPGIKRSRPLATLRAWSVSCNVGYFYTLLNRSTSILLIQRKTDQVARTLRASPLCRQLAVVPTAIINNLLEAPTWCHLESIEYLFGIAVSGMSLEPRSCSPEWAVASKIRNGRQVSALNIRRHLHPTRIVSNVVYHHQTSGMPIVGRGAGLHFSRPSSQRSPNE
jgi:hypothetical protein